MAKPIETLKIAIDFQDKGSQAVIGRLVGSLTKLQTAASGARPNIKGLRTEILAQGNASIKSVSNINAQRTALMALRDEAKIGGSTFKQLTEDIKKLDAQMGKSKSRKGVGARGATQIAGAVISGGIFGGPEGAAGALGGAAFGGVEGAFAGAAIGAQLGGIRQALGAAAEYSAEIGKLKIALEGVTQSEKGAAVSQARYAEALDAAAQSTRDYNVPQGAAIAGITRLTAAVTGAGGPVADAGTTFKNVTAAIKATGGSTEDVRGAITAMVQVFSKGKVSAEELSGQLGERLPGAVTLFAKANKMTLPELQKNLKAGTVGLNELMTFIRALGEEFDGTAKSIASSNEEAGARLTVAFDDMKLSVGNALKDTGAEFQNTFTQFIEEITPKAIEMAEKLAKALKPVIKNLDLILAALAGMAAGAVLVAIGKGIAAIVTAVIGAKTAIAGLTAVMALNPIFAGALAVGGIVAGIVAINKALNGQADALERIKKAGAAKGATGAEIAEAVSTVKQQILEQKAIIDANPEGTTGQGSQARDRRRRNAEAELKRLEKQLADITRTRKPEGTGTEDEFVYDPVKPDGDTGSSKEANALAARVKAAQALERSQIARLNLAKSEGVISTLLAKQLNDREKLSAKITELKKKGTSAEIDRATASAVTNQEKAQELELQKAIEKLYEQAKKPIDDIVKQVQDKVRFDKEYKDLLAEGVNPEIAQEIINITKAKEAALDKFDAEILILEAKKTASDLNDKELKDIEDQIDALRRKKEAIEGEAAGAIGTVTGTQQETTLMEGLTQAIADQEEALKNLIHPLNQITSLADAMGEAFQTSFKGLIDGSMTGKEALASFFQSISDHFMDMAAKIAAEAVKLAALKFVQFIIGAMFGGGGGGDSYEIPDAAVPKTSGMKFFSKGGVFKNGIVPYAKGGIVNKPTLFQYANGGAGNFGLMGEAGAEAILPLKKGPGGKLGVHAFGGGASSIVVNVDASGSSVQGDEQQSKALGNAIGAAVQAEIVKQKMPGGLLN